MPKVNTPADNDSKSVSVDIVASIWQQHFVSLDYVDSLEYVQTT
jgi:hypothetical protein